MKIVAASIAAPFLTGPQASVPSAEGGFDGFLSRSPIVGDAHGTTGRTAPGAVVTSTAVLLLDQIAADDRRRRDREASDRSGRLLSLLKRLQCCTLRHGAETDQVLTDLSLVLDSMPEATDPELARLAASIELRVRVELARRGS